MTERAWSKYQSAIFAFMATMDTHLIVDAKAGSGKTTTLTEMTKRLPKNKKVLMVAFNKKIREELETRVSSQVVVRTFHQLGFYAIMRLWGRVEINKYRQRDIIRSVLPSIERIGRAPYGDITKLVTMAMARLAFTPEEIEQLMDIYDCWPVDPTMVPKYIEWTQTVLRRSQEQSGEISFDDQVYLPAVFNIVGGQYDYVFVDEFQDCNPAQLRIIMNSLRPGGRIIAVGDARQAIYAFRGAGEDNMQELKETLKAIVLPLSVTYRCPKRVVALVNHIVPDLEAAPGAAEGIVAAVGEKEFLTKVRNGDLVISRTNAAIAKYSMALMVKGQRCVVLGKDLSLGLIGLIDKVGREGTKEFLEGLNAYETEESERLVAAKKEDKAEELADRTSALRSLCEGLNTTFALRQRIESLFGDEEVVHSSAVIFSTVHKAKGLEFKRVWMFETTFRTNSTEGENLYYVAATRAMEELYLVQIPTKNGNPRPSPGLDWLAEFDSRF